MNWSRSWIVRTALTRCCVQTKELIRFFLAITLDSFPHLLVMAYTCCSGLMRRWKRSSRRADFQSAITSQYEYTGISPPPQMKNWNNANANDDFHVQDARSGPHYSLKSARACDRKKDADRQKMAAAIASPGALMICARY
jgi:hypothetical protein